MMATLMLASMRKDLQAKPDSSTRLLRFLDWVLRVALARWYVGATLLIATLPAVLLPVASVVLATNALYSRTTAYAQSVATLFLWTLIVYTVYAVIVIVWEALSLVRRLVDEAATAHHPEHSQQ